MTELIEGTPADTLREQAEKAGELVIGSYGLVRRSPAARRSFDVAGHTSGAVVVVENGDRRTVTGEIVLGIDDSADAEPALAYAFEQARLRGCVLRAVHAWQLPVHAFASNNLPLPGGDPPFPPACGARQYSPPGGRNFPRRRWWKGRAQSHPSTPCPMPRPRLIWSSWGSRGMGAIGSRRRASAQPRGRCTAHCPVAVVRVCECQARAAGLRDMRGTEKGLKSSMRGDLSPCW